jgi:hypothetical protein
MPTICANVPQKPRRGTPSTSKRRKYRTFAAGAHIVRPPTGGRPSGRRGAPREHSGGWFTKRRGGTLGADGRGALRGGAGARSGAPGAAGPPDDPSHFAVAGQHQDGTVARATGVSLADRAGREGCVRGWDGPERAAGVPDTRRFSGSACEALAGMWAAAPAGSSLNQPVRGPKRQRAGADLPVAGLCRATDQAAGARHVATGGYVPPARRRRSRRSARR